MRIYLVKYITDELKNTVVCNHLTIDDKTDIVKFIRETYGSRDVYWRLIVGD